MGMHHVFVPRAHVQYAPQGCYNKEADIWSCGVVLYILLCGFPPFQGASARAIFQEVINKPLDLTSANWANISGA